MTEPQPPSHPTRGIPSEPDRPIGAEPFLPEHRDADSLRRAAAECEGCDLYQKATQVVFGEGPAGALLMLVGEQPGDAEDLAGRPFVGPAGQLLDRALAEAAIGRRNVYVTNAVKHFKWEPRGKRRLHAKPSARQVTACSAWLAAELALVRPGVVVCLGATAAQALLGHDFRVSRQRGELLSLVDGRPALATVHPSAILRMTDEGERHKEFQQLVADLRQAMAAAIGDPSGPRAGR